MAIHRKEIVCFLLYILRWECSTPILALCLGWLNGMGTVWATIIANLIGGCLFYFVDKLIFRK